MTLPTHRHRTLSLLICALIALGLLSACRSAAAPTPTVQPVPATPIPSPSPTVEPLGSTGNPLVIGFVNENGQPEANTAARELAVRLTVQTGYAIQGQVFSTYRSLLDEMRGGSVHMAWLPPLTYLYAHAQGYADAFLLTNHFGTYAYGTQIYANVESGYTSFFDPVSNLNTGEPAQALAQLKDAKPCWVEPDSISGYILPAGILDEVGVPVSSDGVITRSATGLIRALYIKGVCDFGATFALTGDPRTSPAVLDDLPDARERVIILWRSDAIIPNLNLSVLPKLPAELTQAVRARLLELVKLEEGRQLLTTANQYDIQDLNSVDDTLYNPLRGAVQRTRTDLNDTIGR